MLLPGRAPPLPQDSRQRQIQRQPRRAAQAHGEDGVPLELPQDDESRRKAARADPVHIAEGRGGLIKEDHGQDGQPRAENQRHHHRPQAGQHILEQGDVLVFLINVGQQGDQNQRRGNAVQSGDDGPRDARDPDAHKSGRVDALKLYPDFDE